MGRLESSKWKVIKMEEHTKAYIAGFLDGDGSLMMQIKPRRHESRFGYRIQATICFYQDTGHQAGLEWIRDQLGVGYLSVRNDGMSEVRINGFDTVQTVLTMIEPYVVFKRRQVSLMLEAIELLKTCSSPEQFLTVCRLCDQLAACNYKSRRRHTAKVVERDFLQRGFCIPVTTDDSKILESEMGV